MKVYTKIVMQWQGDELVTVEEESFDYDGPVAEAKGGDGGNQYYENLNRLYGIQADQAEELMGMARETVFPGYRQMMGEARDYGSEANKTKAAEDAMAATRAATGAAEADLKADLASYGINPADQRHSGNMADMKLRGAGMEAASGTGARERRDKEGFARLQDTVSLGMGTPTQATAAANAAGNTAGTMLNAWNSQQQAQGQAVGNMVQAGINLYGRTNNNGPWSGASGGYVTRAKFAGGGIVGGMRGITPPPPAPRPQQPSVADNVMSVAGTASSPIGQQAVGRGMQQVGNLVGNRTMEAAGMGIRNPAAAKQAAGAMREGIQALPTQTTRQAAEGVVDSALAEGTGTTAANSAANATATTAADTVAADIAATTGNVAAETLTESALALEGGAAIGAAMPWVAGGIAAYGIGQAAGWWADGGEVKPHAVGQTGEVDGPGGPKDDLIPAMLSDGEFVMPRGAVLKFGLDRLEKMRHAGLEYEKQIGIGGQA